jgi:hypothetical protein
MARVLPYPEGTCLVVDGDLTVDGHLSVDDMHALAEAATFDCWGSDMHHFEVTKMSAAVWCTPTRKLPSDLLNLDCEYVVETSRDLEKEGKLFSWILDDAFEAVHAALKSGESIDDSWCVANKQLVSLPSTPTERPRSSGAGRRRAPARQVPDSPKVRATAWKRNDHGTLQRGE